ncbi:hypothetical protein V8G54_032387 [Vigna mungo]|uniref:Uncharacterized protein n=1 Tax=Vigna mungo TaxID=3915 RepID=A0AAQ3MMT1_VIGMU
MTRLIFCEVLKRGFEIQISNLHLRDWNQKPRERNSPSRDKRSIPVSALTCRSTAIGGPSRDSAADQWWKVVSPCRTLPSPSAAIDDHEYMDVHGQGRIIISTQCVVTDLGTMHK